MILAILPLMIFSRISGWLGLVLFAHLGQLDFLFLGHELGRYIGRLVVRRVHRGNVHRQATGEVGIAASQFHQYADLAAVDVSGHVVAGVHADHAAHLDVFPSLAMAAAGFFDGVAGGQLGGLQAVDIGATRGQCGSGDGFAQVNKVAVFGHRVGFRVDFHQYGLAAGLGCGHAAFGSHTAGLFVGLGRADLRSASAAASMSPLVSVSAFLHSIMPAPVRSRSSFTREAVISAIGITSELNTVKPLSRWEKG